MTVRRVEIRLTSTGFDELNKNLDKIDLKLDRLKAKFDDLSKKVISPKIDLRDVTRADAELDRLKLKLDEIGHKRVTATVDVKTNKHDIRKGLEDILGMGKGGGGGLLSDAASGASGGGGVGGGLLSMVGGANNSYFGALIAGLIGVAAAIAPAAIPFGIGGGIGIGGGALAGMLGAKGRAALIADRQALAQAEAALKGKGNQTPSNQLALQQAQHQLRLDQSRYGGFAPFGNDLSRIGNLGLSTLAGAFTSRQFGVSVSPFSSGVSDIQKTFMSKSFLQGLQGILGQVGGFIKSIGPQLGDMFRASIPFVAAFAKIMEQLAKALLPAFTQSMKEMQPFIPQMVQGFKYLSMGIATFIKNLGPGMKDSAIIFKGLMAGIGDTLGFLGTLFSGLAIEVVKVAEGIRHAGKVIAPYFDEIRHDASTIFDRMRHDVAAIWNGMWDDTIGFLLHAVNHLASNMTGWRHETSNIFDGMRHDVAHIWDSMWNDTIGTATRFGQDAETRVNDFSHSVANIFDGARHEIARIWDATWSDTINAVVRGGHDVEARFDDMTHSVYSIVDHLPGQLWKLGQSALTELENGMKSVWTGLWGWLKNTVGGIVGKVEHLLHMSPPHPGSAFYDLGANMMKHLEAGVKSKVGAVQGAVHGSFKAIGGSATGWIEQAMNLVHAPKSWLPALERLVSLESGGNPTIVDPISVDGQHATGLWQMLPSTFAEYSRGGSIDNPVAEGVSALRYIMQQYGSPFNIPGLMTGHYVGYAKGGWINEPVFGLGTKSGSMYGIGENGPEYVSPHGAGGVTIVVNANGLVNPSGIANEIWMELRNLKRTRGNQALGLS